MEDIFIYLFNIENKTDYNNTLIKLACQYAKENGISFEDNTILRTDKNKPYFKWNPFHFSVSHSKEVLGIAFSKYPLGLDIQDHRNCKKEKIAKKFFHPDEIAHVNSENFFKIWTAKESYVKFKGNGIDKTFREFSVFDNIENYNFSEFEHHTLCVYSERKVKLHLQTSKNIV